MLTTLFPIGTVFVPQGEDSKDVKSETTSGVPLRLYCAVSAIWSLDGNIHVSPANHVPGFSRSRRSIAGAHEELWLRLPGRPGPRGEPGAARDDLLWRLEHEDAAVRGAQLMSCDVLPLYEPTGRLDVDNVRWLEDWL